MAGLNGTTSSGLWTSDYYCVCQRTSYSSFVCSTKLIQLQTFNTTFTKPIYAGFDFWLFRCLGTLTLPQTVYRLHEVLLVL